MFCINLGIQSSIINGNKKSLERVQGKGQRTSPPFLVQNILRGDLIMVISKMMC